MVETSAYTDPLETELVALGRALAIAPPREDLAATVLARLATHTDASPGSAGPAPGDRTRGVSGAGDHGGQPRLSRRRLVSAMAAAALLIVVLVPPVRAAVLEFFRIGGVTVEQVPTPTGPGSNRLPTPTAGAATPEPGDVIVPSLEEARRRTGLDLKVPSGLGAPTRTVVSHEGRVVELTWGVGSGSTRLDVFDGTLSWGYLKQVWVAVTPTQVGSRDAVWFADTHLIEWIDRSGASNTSAPRMAGPTLVWVEAGTSGHELTYRLEGPTSLDSALAIATTVP